MGRLDRRLAERLVAELRGGRKVTVQARSNDVPLSALCRPHQCTIDSFQKGFGGVIV